MSRDLRAFLERVVLDDGFRALVRRDPDAAFEGYDLPPEDRAVLAAADARVLALIGRVLWADTPRAPTATLGALDLSPRPMVAPPTSLDALVQRVRTAAPGARFERVVDLVEALAARRENR